MGNSQAKKTNKMMDQEQSRLLGDNSAYNSQMGRERNQTKSWSDSARDDIYGGYKNLMDPNFGGAGGSGGGGGYTAPQMSLHKTLQGLKTDDYGKLKQGAHDALSGYNEFAKTGGYSDSDQANIRARSNSTIPSFMEGLRNNMSQKANAAGSNVGSIFSSASGRLARQGAQAAGEQASNTEMDLSDRIRSGRQWGIGGQADIGKVGLSGMQDIGNTEQSIQNENDQAAASAANANASAASGARDDQYRRYMSGLGGMQEMYGSSPAELARYDDMAMQNRGLTGGLVGNNLDRKAAYNPNVSTMDKIGKIAGTVGKVAGTAAMFSSRELKDNIVELDPQTVAEGLKKLKLYNWNYKGEKIRHMGPIAEEFKEIFGVGDGVTINIIDVMAVLLAAEKARL